MSLNRRIKTATGATLLSAIILLTSFFGAASPSYAAEPITVGGKVEVVDTDGDTIRMRSGAGTVNEQVGEAHEGQVLSVLAGPERDVKGYRWFKVKGPGGTGWIVAGYLEGKAGTAPAKTTTSASTTTSKQVTKPAAKIVGFGKVANTDGDPLRVRKAANSQGSVITKLAPRTVVAVKQGPLTDDEGIAWYQVSANGVTGWAMAQYLTQSQAPAEVTSAAKPATQAAVAPAAPSAKEPAAQAPAAPASAVQPAADTIKATLQQTEPALTTSGRADTIVDTAMNYVGYRYRYGGTSPSGFDCSGFVYYVLNKSGVPMSRNMGGQLASGPRVNAKDLQPGDLVFFSNTYKRGLSHAGIYIGNGRFIHAENERTGVRVSDLWSAYWGAHYTAAVRPTK